MNTEILEYLKTQRVCVLAVEMPDGSPHAATVHFTYTEDPLTFVILTSPTSRKYEAFVKNPARASMVIGTTEEGAATFQLDGEIRLSDNKKLRQLYDEKFPKAAHLFAKDMLFTFTPKWWRFTSWPSGKKAVLLSELNSNFVPTFQSSISCYCFVTYEETDTDGAWRYDLQERKRISALFAHAKGFHAKETILGGGP